MKDIRNIEWNEIEKGMRIRVNADVVWEFQEYDIENDEWNIIVYTIENGELRKPFEASISQDEYENEQNDYENIRELDLLDLYENFEV